MSLVRFSSFAVFYVAILCFTLNTYTQASTLQVSPTVTLENSATVYEGTVVISFDDKERYSISELNNSKDVFGVTASRPALVFSTGDNQTPVVTEGIALVQVNNSNGQIQRGDLLITSFIAGVAMKAGENDTNVFAIALEDYTETSEDAIGLIQVDVGVDRAQLVLASRINNDSSKNSESAGISTLARASVAVVLVVGALLFILYSFRSTLSQGVVSVGRNPRARSSIIALAFGNILFSVLLFGIVVFIAVAILILPI